MTRKTIWFALMVLTGSIPAQKQTGAPPGIPVPQPPRASQAEDGPLPVSPAYFRVHLVDGRNGAPLQGAHLTLWYDEETSAGALLTTDVRGTATMPAPLGTPVRVLVSLTGLIDCRKGADGNLPQGFNLQDIAAHGLSAENRCGPVGSHARPGELVLFARPPRWYEGLNRDTGR